MTRKAIFGVHLSSGVVAGVVILIMYWHRWFGAEGENRAVARAVTGACNLAFCLLTITGLYIWWPRKWTLTAVKAIIIPNFKVKGKNRNFNWHNSFGIWCLPLSRSTLTVTTSKAQVVEWKPFTSLNLGRQVRSWLRWIHTGEAAGWIGQLIAGVASTGAVVLVWTGLSLAWRRFRRFSSTRQQTV